MNFDSPPKVPQQRNSCYLLSMQSRYPFDKHISSQTDCLVKFKLQVPPQSHKQTQTLLKKYSALKHEALIEIVNMFECKEGWDIHYEYVPLSLTTGLRKMAEEEIARAKKVLMNVAEYLIMKDIRPVFNQYNVGFINNFPKVFLNLYCIKELTAEHKMNEITLLLELQIDTLFKQFASKQEVETMDQFETMTRVQYNRVEMIDKRIAQIKRRMSENNSSLEKVGSLGNLKQLFNEDLGDPKNKKQKKPSLKDYIKSPEARTRVSPNKYGAPKITPSQIETTIAPTFPSLTSTKNEAITLFSPRNDTSQRFSEFDCKQISVMSKKRKATFDLKFKESLLKTEEALNYYEKNK